ncbi:Zinc finger, RING/FYVE/PHD-type, partial [Cynara cardunculus var. scolymus]
AVIYRQKINLLSNPCIHRFLSVLHLQSSRYFLPISIFFQQFSTMVYDSIANASIPTAASNSKDFGKKKRVNRTAKLKQCKLDVRREQWLSQVKNRGFKEETHGTGGMKAPAPETHAANEREPPVVNLEVNLGGEETEADALAADDIQKNHNDPNLVSPVDEQLDFHTIPEPEPVLTTPAGQEDCRPPTSFRAWRPDDASRPQNLPNLLKQNSFPMKSGKHYGLHSGGFAPSSCPICCEDLDMTDSSFLPCPCGYRLCLFCHKRILEDNGRCPGCRKLYAQPDNGNASSKMARSCSMNPRH